MHSWKKGARCLGLGEEWVSASIFVKQTIAIWWDWEGTARLQGSVIGISRLTKLKGMVPGDKLSPGPLPKYKRFPRCTCRAESQGIVVVASHHPRGGEVVGLGT